MRLLCELRTAADVLGWVGSAVCWAGSAVLGAGLGWQCWAGLGWESAGGELVIRVGGGRRIASVRTMALANHVIGIGRDY